MRHLLRHKTISAVLSVSLFCCVLGAAVPAFALDSDATTDPNTINTQQVPDSSFLYDTSIYNLSLADASYEGQTVQVTGEAIGDSVRNEYDDEHRWVTLASLEEGKEGSIAVLVTAEQADRIDTFGRYGQKGSTLRVRGTFHLACPDHEGLTDIHADTFAVVEKGTVAAREFDAMKLIPGLILAGVGLVLVMVFHMLRERLR